MTFEASMCGVGTLGAYGIATSTMFNGYGDHAMIPVGDVFNG